MANELTRVGTKGLELTREEVIDIKCEASAILRKAQCREVNCDVLELLSDVVAELVNVESKITEILEDR